MVSYVLPWYQNTKRRIRNTSWWLLVFPKCLLPSPNLTHFDYLFSSLPVCVKWTKRNMAKPNWIFLFRYFPSFAAFINYYYLVVVTLPMDQFSNITGSWRLHWCCGLYLLRFDKSSSKYNWPVCILLRKKNLMTDSSQWAVNGCFKKTSGNKSSGKPGVWPCVILNATWRTPCPGLLPANPDGLVISVPAWRRCAPVVSSPGEASLISWSDDPFRPS